MILDTSWRDRETLDDVFFVKTPDINESVYSL